MTLPLEQEPKVALTAAVLIGLWVALRLGVWLNKDV